MTVHKIPGTTILHEKERILGGLAEVGSEEAAAIVARVRRQLGVAKFLGKDAARAAVVEDAPVPRVTPTVIRRQE
jgi:hypothetical protein